MIVKNCLLGKTEILTAKNGGKMPPFLCVFYSSQAAFFVLTARILEISTFGVLPS